MLCEYRVLTVSFCSDRMYFLLEQLVVLTLDVYHVLTAGLISRVICGCGRDYHPGINYATVELEKKFSILDETITFLAFIRARRSSSSHKDREGYKGGTN